MNYLEYTHNLIIKTPNEIIRGDLVFDSRIKGFRESDSANNIPVQNIIIPGFINLHSHLSYTNFQIPSQNLFTWLKELVAKTNQGFSPSSNSVDGVKELLSNGTTFVVDNSNHPLESYKAMKDSGIKGLIGIEIFGSNPEEAKKIFQEKLLELQSLPKDKDIEFTFSPHASYDVSPELWQKTIEWCKANNKKLLTHVAESLAEEKWFQDNNAKEAQSAKDFWQSINTLDIKLKNWKSYSSGIQYLYENKMLDPCLLITHMVHAQKQDLELISKLKIPLATCPKSNLYLGNGLPDYELWQKLSIEYGIGTDSKASNTSLDLRRELKEIRNISAKEKFELITNKAAKIIAKDQEIGSLEPGKAADFVVLEIKPKDIDLDTINIFNLIMDPDLTKIKSVFVNGILVYMNPAPTASL